MYLVAVAVSFAGIETSYAIYSDSHVLSSSG